MGNRIADERVVIPPDHPLVADLNAKVKEAFEAAIVLATKIGEPSAEHMEAFNHVVVSLLNVSQIKADNLAKIMGAALAMASWPYGKDRQTFLEIAADQVAYTLQDLAEREAAGNPLPKVQ